MSAHPAAAAIMTPLDRMETLAVRLALHNRLLGEALDEASEIPAAADLDAVKDGLAVWVLQQEQLRELDQLVQDAHVAAQKDRRILAASTARRPSVVDLFIPPNERGAETGPGSIAAIRSDIDRRKTEIEELQDRLDRAEAVLAKDKATDVSGVMAQVSAAIGHLVHDDAEAKAVLAAGDFDALAAGNLDFPAKLLAQALRGLDAMAGDRTVSEDPGSVFLAVQAGFNAGEVPEADFDAAYEKVAAWQPSTPLEFTRKALCLLADGKLPERDIIDRLMEQAARLVA